MSVKIRVYSDNPKAKNILGRSGIEFIPLTKRGFQQKLIEKNAFRLDAVSLQQKLKSFSKALLTGKKVADKIRIRREEICAKCHYLDKKSNRCTICGCKVRDFWKTMNLAAYEENLPEWGCKHPRRLQNEGWEILNEQTRKVLQEREAVKAKRLEMKKQLNQGAHLIGGRRNG